VHDSEARAILESRLETGARLVVAQESDWTSIKRLQVRCHEAGVPTMLARGPAGG
jgi:hypothetical protein